MELFIGAVAILAIVLLLARSSRPDKHDGPAMEDPSSGPNRRSRPVFNPATAKHFAPPKVIRGAAYVTDGDTIVIDKTQVRLFGIDAPELDHPYGQKAKWEMVKLCKGRTVRAEITDMDHYGRTVARCYLEDGRDLSAEMVKQGLALGWGKFSGDTYTRLETPDARKKLWLADARQKGRMHVWEKFASRPSEDRQNS
jgi:endonuclease YncB( thermonuclease family)